MQDLNNNASFGFESGKSFLPVRSLMRNFKKYFFPWLIISAVVGTFIFTTASAIDLINRAISVDIIFNFDGIESGYDPLGNKFDVNEIKSPEAVKASLEELKIEYDDVEEICSSISIIGSTPLNVIDRITAYESRFDSDEIVTLENIQDKTYYPTQYKITMDCHKTELDYSDCVEFLNNLTEKYKTIFSENYGYKKTLSEAVTSFDYTEYDYSEAINIFDSSLESLQSYVNSLAAKDSERFKSEVTGYTFSDLSKSIETIRSEDLPILLSYVTLYSMTKNKDELITNYEYRIEGYKRQKTINEETLKAIKNTLDVYEKNSILIFAQSTSGADATLNQSSDTYDTLIEMQVNTEKNISWYQQQINKYTDRIKKLNAKSQSGSVEKLEEDFAAVDKKIDLLLQEVEKTAIDYHENIVFLTAYEILSPADDSVLSVIANSVKESMILCFAVELLVLSGYIIVCVLFLNDKIHGCLTFRFKKNASGAGSKRNKKSKGGRK